MVAIFEFILDLIRIDLIIGFGWYSVVFFILKWCSYKEEFLLEFDKKACKTVVFLGILFAIVWVMLITFNYFVLMKSQEQSEFIQRITGPYAYAYFGQPLFWLILTQLLRINFIKRFFLLRLIICVWFVLTFERLIIMITSFHRDYLPSSWTMYTSDFNLVWWKIILLAIGKMIEFLIAVLIWDYVKKSISKFKTAEKN